MPRDSVRLVRDTLRQTRVETIESAFLDEGVFRAFEVNFAFGTATLQPRATRTLDAVGRVLEQYPDVRVAVTGHTDAVGPDSVNARLSRARAAAVRAYLADRYAVAPDRLVARGDGETRPIASNQTAAGRALNRRVEFRVLNPDALSRPRP
jgi:outer membrane protein OmpA-like peptidoglycan-associated protein